MSDDDVVITRYEYQQLYEVLRVGIEALEQKRAAIGITLEEAKRAYGQINERIVECQRVRATYIKQHDGRERI